VVVPRIPHPDEMLAAYSAGWFPMDIDGHIGFYEFSPRAIIPLDGFRVPRSVRRALRDEVFDVRLDTAFAEVVRECAAPRDGGEWLSPSLARAYQELHVRGYAHSVEVWFAGRLVGGLFGVALGGLFTSESMFHRVGNAGNAALVAAYAHLTRRGYTLWDIQMTSPHTARFGALELSPADYRRRLRPALGLPVTFGADSCGGGVATELGGPQT
jgi:leucyl/phenylalanyl-tRNA---protein transferase